VETGRNRILNRIFINRTWKSRVDALDSGEHNQDRGSLELGKLADIVILSHDLYVMRTFINGLEFLT
jgi:hypothetical protein